MAVMAKCSLEEQRVLLFLQDPFESLSGSFAAEQA
jgi:hypothetical protein